MTVADTMTALTTTKKPVPLDVHVVEAKLEGGKEAFRFWVANLILWNIRALAVWGFLAVFFPALGATYIMVLVGIWVARHAVPSDPKEIVRAIARSRK